VPYSRAIETSAITAGARPAAGLIDVVVLDEDVGAHDVSILGIVLDGCA